MKRSIILSLLMCLYMCLKAQVSDQLEMLDIFNLEYVSDPQISPDGTRVIYVRNFKDVMTDKNLSNLWIASFDGSTNRPLTTGDFNDRTPKWSNDGSMVVYLSNKSGENELYLKWMDSGEEMILINSENSPGNVRWSPNDKYLSFNMFVAEAKVSPIRMPQKPKNAEWNAPPKYIDNLNWRRDGVGELPSGYQQLFTVPISGGTPRQLTDGPYNHSNAVWGKDGETLYFSANMRDDIEMEGSDSDLYSLKISDGSITKLTNRYGPDNSPRISPDGKKIAYLGFDDEYKGYQQSKLYIANIDGSKSQLISGDFDRSISNINWASDAKGIYFQYMKKRSPKSLISLLRAR